MAVSPNGRWVVGQRADVTVVVDTDAMTTRELSLQTLRHAFGDGDVVYATAASTKVLWDSFGAAFTFYAGAAFTALALLALAWRPLLPAPRA